VTELATQIGRLAEQLETLVAVEENRQVIEELDHAIDQIEPEYHACVEVIHCRRTLETRPDRFATEQFATSESIVANETKEKLLRLKEVWTEDRRRVWHSGAAGEFRDALEAFRVCLEQNNQTLWLQWIKELEQRFLISEVELESIKNVPAYQESVRRYRIEFQNFQDLSKRVPDEASKIEDVERLAGDLHCIRTGINFDLPNDVLKFFDRLDRDGFVPLRDLDENVRHWLAENNGLKDLAVSRRETYRR